MYSNFTDMPVWQEAMKVAENIFELTLPLPKQEDYGLTSQIRRAALSISANIAEAYGRRTSLDKRKFYDYARGSAFETQNHIIYGTRVGYFSPDQAENIHAKINQIIHDINKIIKSLH